MSLEDPLPSMWGYVLAPLPGQDGEGLFWVLFPKMTSSWEGPGIALSLSRGLIPLPMHSMGMPHARNYLCSACGQLCLSPFWL